MVKKTALTKQQKKEFLDLLKKEPRRFIAQEVIDFLDIDILENGQFLIDIPESTELEQNIDVIEMFK